MGGFGPDTWAPLPAGTAQDPRLGLHCDCIVALLCLCNSVSAHPLLRRVYTEYSYYATRHGPDGTDLEVVGTQL